MGRSKLLSDGLKVYDILTMALWFLAAVLLVSPVLNSASLQDFLALRFSVGNILFFLGFAIFWLILFASFRLYGNIRLSNSYREILDVVKATTFGSFALALLAVPLAIEIIDLRFLLVFWLGTTILSLGGRYTARKLLKHFISREQNLCRLLIVGVNERSLRFAQQIEATPGLGYRLVGFVDDGSDQLPGFEATGYAIVAGLDGLPDYLRRTALDEVLICLPIKSRYGDTLRIVSICEDQGISVGLLGDLLQCKLTRSRAEPLGDDTLIMVRPHNINGVPAAIKHAIDIVVSGISIVVLLPVFLITALLIKLVSPGPVFFSQERVGLHKKTFRMLKFRTMIPNAADQLADLEQLNEASGAAFKIKNDPRITPIGKYLRKLSIDELPQLINVLRGEMSLVGPRPLPMRDYEEFSEDWHRRRVSVRPGITCLWQINGRNHDSFDDWMRQDLHYINNWSLLLDLKVMLMTVPAVLKGSGD